MAAPPPRRRSQPFRPHGTLALMWFGFFFVVYCLALIAPALWPVLRDVAPGPEQQQLAEEVAREAIRGRLLLAFLAALATAALGAWLKILPGLRH